MSRLVRVVKDVVIFVVIYLLLWQAWPLLAFVIGGKLYYQYLGIWAVLNALITFQVIKWRRLGTKQDVEPREG